MSKYKLSRRSKSRIKGINKSLIMLIERSLDKSKHDFGIPRYGGKRTAKEQNVLYKADKSNCDGYIIESNHQSGNAFDIFIYDEHGACWECKHKYKDVAATIKSEFRLMKQEGLFDNDVIIRWGGDWKNFIDLPHFEIKKIIIKAT